MSSRDARRESAPELEPGSRSPTRTTVLTVKTANAEQKEAPPPKIGHLMMSTAVQGSALAGQLYLIIMHTPAVLRMEFKCHGYDFELRAEMHAFFSRLSAWEQV